MGRIDADQQIKRVTLNPIDETPKKQVKQTPDKKTEAVPSPNVNSQYALSNLKQYSQQQKDRLTAIAYGAGGHSAFRDVQLAKAANKANLAYEQTFNKEFAKFADYDAKLKSGTSIAKYDGAKTYSEVTARAETAYRTELRRGGFNAPDVRGTSVFKAADFLMSPSNRSGQLTTLSAEQIRGRVAHGDKPGYLVRLVEPKYMNSPEAKLAAPDRKYAWVASADEIAGTKGDLYETMRRIGYKESDIQWTKSKIDSGDKKVSDYALAIVETDGAKGRTTPTWDTLISDAKGNPNFVDFKSKKPEFWENVKNFEHNGMNYDQHLERMGKTKISEYTAKFPPEKAKAFEARNLIQQEYGANPLFTGDGTTLRPDLQNNRVGAREWFVENLPLRDQQKSTLIPLQDLKLGDNPTVKTQTSVRTVAENPLRLRGEMRSGGIAGGAFSAVTSLPEVFDRAKRGDFKGAATTLAVNTGGGATLGALSSGGERIVGRGLENALSRSNLAENGLERLYTSGAARNLTSRMAGMETSNISSQAFNSTVRTFAGRVGGAGVVGGVVNGAFSAYDQIGAYRRGEVTASQAIGTVTGEAAVGVGAGMAGAAAGAAIGSIIPGAGTIVGGVVGFGVGMAAGYLADKGLRGLGVNKAIAKGVTATIDAGSRLAGTVHKQASQALQAGRQYVSQKVTQAKAVYRSASTAVKTARAYVGQKLDNVRQRVSGATRAAVNYVSQVKDRAVQAVRNTASQAVNQVRSTVSNAVSQARSTVSNVANQARSTVSNAVSNLTGGAASTLKSVFGW